MARIREDLIDRNMWYKLYADDLVIIIKHRDIHDLLRSLRHWSADFSLKINEKKSGIFLNQKQLSPEESFIDGFPVIGSYPYLGVALNNKGNLKPQMNVIKRRADYLIRAMKYVAKDLTFENQFLIWSAYIRPYFQYICTLISRNPTADNPEELPLPLEEHLEAIPRPLPSSIPNTIFSQDHDEHGPDVSTEARVRSRYR